MNEGRQRLVAGTRGSALARWQTDHVSALLRDRQVDVDVKVITTQGDVSLAERLVGNIEKGFFSAELEAELRSGAIDFAVHSLKDLPTRLPDDLDVVAVLERADAFDLLLVRPDFVIDRGADRLPLKPDTRVGTSSLRRDALIKAFAPGTASLPLRGNVPTRLNKLASGEYDAIILAAAGVRRLGLDVSAFHAFELDPRRWPPAPGQGSVAVEARKQDANVRAAFGTIDHPASRRACETERAYLRVLEGGCTTPFGCYVDPRGDGNVAYMGRAGLTGETAPWRAACVRVEGDSTAEYARGLAVLDASTSIETFGGASAAASQAASQVKNVPLFRKV
jgi:hydroxymethylbilane synthase